MNLEIQSESSEVVNDNITLKKRIKLIILGIIWFLAIPLSLIGVLLKPIYKMVYYGQANNYFKYGIAIVLLISFFFIIKFLIQKKMNIQFKKENTKLSWKMLCALYFGSFLLVFIISAALGFELKPTHDIGNNMPAYEIGQFFTKLGYRAIGLFFALNMIECFQYALEDLFPFKDKKFAAYIPYGAVVTMLTYGLYAYFTGVGGSLAILYIFFVLLYGEIYLLCKRNILKAYAFCVLIFLL